MQAIEAFIESQGGPEVIDWREVTLGDPDRAERPGGATPPRGDPA